MYKLNNGRTTGKFLQIQIGEDKPWIKIITLSDKTMTEEEFTKFMYWRRHFKIPPVNNEMVELKSEDIEKA